MKRFLKVTIYLIVSLLVFVAPSCKSYLDREDDTTVSPDDAFKNFINFQGFTEELYYCIPETSKFYWQNSFNWGEDEIIVAGATWFMGYKIDNGDFWGWQREHDGWGAGWMDGEGITTDRGGRFNKRFWPLAWYGIRKANMGLENIDKLTDATQEEKDLIRGQLYFFRGWFHFQLISYFGGLPYIDKTLPADQKLELPRLKYQETALLAAQDFELAAQLLPADWDKTEAGKRTLGKNGQRINKIMALGYLGKNYLYAASPLMNLESTGSRTYDPALCKKAAEAFATLLKLSDSGQTYHKLADFKDYSSIFYTLNQGYKIPGYPESIMQSPAYDAGGTRWGLNEQYVAGVLFNGGSVCFSPTANYVNNYGMANGLPIPNAEKADPLSGYDPNDPWTGRDPRFYHDIIFDGVKMIQGITATREAHRYANLYTKGSYRDENNGSRTGYLNGKFIPRTTNYDDFGHDRSHFIHLSFMRMADVYLMYAEAALHGYGTPANGFPGYLSAAEAVNKVRQRAGVGSVNAKFLASKEAFMSELIRERAVELAYEGHRFNDLRRWLLLTERPYTLKTAHDFDRMPNGKVANLRERVILERKFNVKHYWLPLKVSDVSMTPAFRQNPGW